MKNRDGALAIPVMRMYYKVIAIKHEAVTDRPMEQNRSLEQTSISMETTDEKVPQLNGGKHGCFWRYYWKMCLIK